MFLSVLSAVLAVGALGSAPPYTVDHSVLRGRSVIVDKYGRETVFRGVNLGVEIWRGDKRPWDPESYANGRCPSAVGSVNQPPVCGVEAGRGKWNQSTKFESRNDLAQIRAFGFNLIRLAISWSLLEPEPLQYSAQYLDRIAQVVAWAAEQDIPVILDMHQDAYSPSVGGSDGAPAWACLNASLPWWIEAAWPEVSKVVPYTKAVLSAFDGLYMNREVNSTGKGLQEHFLLAWAEVIKRFDASPNVIGYEILNEPPPGILTTVGSFEDVPVIGFASKYLYPMYKRFIQAMTGVRDGLQDCPKEQPVGADCAFPDLGTKSKKLVFFEPNALRNQLDFSLQFSRPFTEYENIVFAPHVYTNFFTAPHWPPTYRLALDSAWFEANLMRAGVLATEYGGSSSSPEKVGNLTNQFDLHRGTSGTVWTWKERGNWGMFNSSEDPAAPNGPLNAVRVQINSRIYARAVAGGILEHTFDRRTGSFLLRAAAGIHWTKPTEVYVPAHLAALATSVGGAASLRGDARQPDGSRIIEVMPWITGGLYSISVGGEMQDKSEVPQDDGKYVGVSQSAMEDVGRAVWPLLDPRRNGAAPAPAAALPEALALVAKEIYNSTRGQEAVFL